MDHNNNNDECLEFYPWLIKQMSQYFAATTAVSANGLEEDEQDDKENNNINNNNKSNNNNYHTHQLVHLKQNLPMYQFRLLIQVIHQSGYLRLIQQRNQMTNTNSTSTLSLFVISRCKNTVPEVL